MGVGRHPSPQEAFPLLQTCIRPLAEHDSAFLHEMLYEAIYTPPGEPRPARSVLTFPGIARYVEGWGRPGDRAFIAQTAGTPGGAAWYRLMRGYGYVADDIPELSIAVAPGHRGRALGTALLEALVSQAREDGYRGLSLSVDPANPAIRLYRRFGFAQVGVDGTSAIMLKLF